MTNEIRQNSCTFDNQFSIKILAFDVFDYEDFKFESWQREKIREVFNNN